MPRSVEIKTAHNIVVHFDLATLMERILAVVIDLVIAMIVAGIIAAVISSMGLEGVGSGLVLLILGLYHLGFEIFNSGQSPGKRLLQIKVVNLKGLPPSTGEAFQRWVFRAIDVTFSIGTLASLFITSSTKNQRIGDLISGCAVIKVKKNKDISLDRVRRIQGREREIRYPAVIRFEEKDMLLIKEVLQRYSLIKNESTRRATRSLAAKVAEELNVSMRQVEINVLKDYVTLTR